MSEFDLELQSLIFKLECYKTYPAPWLKNTSVVYRDEDGTFTDKSKLSTADQDSAPAMLDSEEYGEASNSVSKVIQENPTILTGEDQENFSELLKTNQGSKFFKGLKNILDNSDEKIKRIGEDLVDGVKNNLENNEKSFLSVGDHVINSLQQSATIKSNPMENITIGTSILTGLSSLGNLTETLKENIFSDLGFKEWSLSESINSANESLHEMLREKTNLESQKNIPDIIKPIVGLVHDQLVSDKNKMEELNSLIGKNKGKDLSNLLPNDSFVKVMEDAGLNKVNTFLKAQEKFESQGLNLDKLLIHAVKENDQSVPLSKRIKQFNNNNSKTLDTKNLSWLKDYLKIEQKYGDQILDLSNSRNKSQRNQSYKEFIKEFKSNQSGKTRISNPKLAITNTVDGKEEPVTDEKLKEFAARLIEVETKAKVRSGYKETLKLGENINKEVKGWINEISSLVNTDIKFLPITAGGNDRDFVLNPDAKWVEEITKKEEITEDYEKKESSYTIDVPPMAISTHSFGLQGYYNENKEIPERSKDRIKSNTFHEFGHVLENSNPEIHKQAKEFLYERGSGEVIDELARGNGIQLDGGFIDSYAGRLYINPDKLNELIQKHNNGTLSSDTVKIKKSDILENCTEIISVGTQHLSNPDIMKKLSDKDKDHLTFVLTMMSK